MGIFSKKQEVNLENFCRDFYEKNYLNPVIEGVDVSDVFYDTSLRSIEEVDSDFDVDPKYFVAEIRLLQFELFALAWLHKFGDKLAVAQSVFTKNYLEENKRNDIWEESEDYNQAIARSSTAGKSKEKAFDRVYLARVYKTRADLFDQFHKESLDPKCVARALNRLFSDEAWKKDIIPNFLMFTLCDRLGFKQDELNKEAQQRLTFVIRMIYDGAKQSLDNIKIKN
ncbi:MAG: hypothetical protein Q7S74_02510 [Nanoarchaeota archaeon]|nr:hypothetical protein [Nanoarchaeota archaeon]